jgi:hypothetical protein
MLRRAVSQKLTDVSEALTASIIRAIFARLHGATLVFILAGTNEEKRKRTTTEF